MSVRIDVPTDVLAKLDHMAQFRHRTRADYIRAILTEHVTERYAGYLDDDSTELA